MPYSFGKTIYFSPKRIMQALRLNSDMVLYFYMLCHSLEYFQSRSEGNQPTSLFSLCFKYYCCITWLILYKRAAIAYLLFCCLALSHNTTHLIFTSVILHFALPIGNDSRLDTGNSQNDCRLLIFTQLQVASNSCKTMMPTR